MEWFSDWSGGVLFTCGFSTLIVLLVALYLNVGKPRPLGKALLFLITAFILSCVIGLSISSFLIRVTQVSVIAPKVQAALDKVCGSGKFIASEGEFYEDSRFRWRSSNNSAQCGDYQEGWVCSCSSK